MNPGDPRVLLVEDHEINRDVTKIVLSSMGLEVDAVNNGLEAVERLKALEGGYYSLVLMDCEMPVMDGFSATQAIREGFAGKQHKTLPVIALTANAMHGDKEACIKAGMNDYVSKPLDVSQLSGVLAPYLKSGPA